MAAINARPGLSYRGENLDSFDELALGRVDTDYRTALRTF